MHKFEIKIGKTARESSIAIDGKRLESVVEFSVAVNPARANHFELRLEVHGEALIDGEFHPEDILKVRREL